MRRIISILMENEPGALSRVIGLFSQRGYNIETLNVAATEDATEGAVELLSNRSDLSPEEAYMLLGIVGELRIGTSPRPTMAARLIIPNQVLQHVGWRGLF